MLRYYNTKCAFVILKISQKEESEDYSPYEFLGKILMVANKI